MARKATDQVTTIGIDIGKNSFHLIGLYGRRGSCVDGSLLARVFLRFVQTGRVQSCVRPVDAV